MNSYRWYRTVECGSDSKESRNVIHEIKVVKVSVKYSRVIFCI